jgi:hypothetical protein
MDCDVIVIGGGTAGLTAALTARRHGARSPPRPAPLARQLHLRLDLLHRVGAIDAHLVRVARVVAGAQAKLQRGNTPCVPSQPTPCLPSVCPGVRTPGGSSAQRRAIAAANSGS